MADWETIQERTISGKGVLQVPTDVRKNRAYVLFATVVRKPSNPYLNFNWNPPRGRYATLVFLRQGYVVDTRAMEYEKHAWDGVNDIAGQALIAIKCSYQGVLDSIRNLAIAISGTPGGIGLTYTFTENAIQDYENLRLAWDEIRVKCYADTAVSLRLSSLQYDVCNADFNDDKPPPDPPDPPTFPPGTPLFIDSPYDPTTNDNGNTEPYPIDGVDPCEGVGVWTIGYVATPGGANTSYIKGKVGDTFYLQLDPAPGCRDGMGQNLYSDGILVYSGFTCTSRATLTSFSFSLGEPPGGVTVEPNPRYPGC